MTRLIFCLPLIWIFVLFSASSPNKKNKTKVAKYKVNAEQSKLIKEDSLNQKLWDEALEHTSEGHQVILCHIKCRILFLSTTILVSVYITLVSASVATDDRSTVTFVSYDWWSERIFSSPVRSTRRAIVVTPVTPVVRVCVPVPVTLR